MAVFVYDFNGTDTAAGSGIPSPAGLPALEVVSGSWRRLANRAHTDTPAASRPIIVAAGGAGNFDLSFTVSPNGGDAGYGRVTDAANWICARLRRYTVTVPSGYTEYTWTGIYGGASSGGGTAHNNGTTNAHGDYAYTYTSTSNTAYPGPSSNTAFGHQHVNGEILSHSVPLKSSSVTSSRFISTTSSAPAWQVILEKSVGGVVTTLATANVSSPTQLRMSGVGPALRVFVGTSTTAAISVTDTSFLTVGRHGIGRGPSDSSGTGLDNLSLDTLNSPPNAPSLTIPAVINRTRPLVVAVPFSDPDQGDSASASFLRYRPESGGDWVTISRLSPNTNVTIPADALTDGVRYEIQGASRDAQGLPEGDANLRWSASVFTLASTPPPGVVFVDPTAGEQIPAETQTYTVTIPTTQQLEWQVVGDLAGAPDLTNVIDPGGIIADPDARTFTATGLPNATVVHARARGYIDGLAGDWVTQSNLVSYTPPAVVGLSVRPISTIPNPYGATDAILVELLNPVPSGGQPAVGSHRIFRRAGTTGDGIRIVVDHPAGQAYVDRTPASGVDYAYRVESIAANGTTSTTEWISDAVDLVPGTPGTPETPGDEGDFADADFATADFD